LAKCSKPSDHARDAFGLNEVGDVVDRSMKELQLEGVGNACCPYGVPPIELLRVQDVYAFLGEILVQLVKKAKYLEGEK